MGKNRAQWIQTGNGMEDEQVKILYVASLYPPDVRGGAEIVLKNQVEAMRDRGAEVAVLTTSDCSGIRREQVNGVPVWRTGIRNIYWHYRFENRNAVSKLVWHAIDQNNPFMGGRFEQVAREFQPDIVTTHNLTGWSVSVWSRARKLNIPVVHVLHDYYLMCPRSTMFDGRRNCDRICLKCRLFRLRHKSLSGGVTAAVGVSRFVLNRHRNMGYFAGVPFRETIYNGEEPGDPPAIAAFPADAPASEGATASVRFGYMGALSPSKGIEKLLEVFSKEVNENVQLFVAGEGSCSYEQRLIQTYQSRHIRFLGWMKPEDFYGKIDVLIVPSVCHDPYPGVVREAIGEGKIVVGSRRGGVPEMIQDQLTGILYEPDQAGELAGIVAKLATDRLYVRQLKENMASTQVGFTSLEDNTNRYEVLYKRVLEHHKRRTAT